MWDWRFPIDDLRSDIRKHRSEDQSSISLDDLESYLDSLSSIYSRLERDNPGNGGAESGDDFSRFVDSQRDMVSKVYEQSKQYANILVLGGYAGLFAVWNFTKDDLESWQVFTVGLFSILSLLIYIAFELYSSWVRSSQVNNLTKSLDKIEEARFIPEEYGREELRRSQFFMKIWPYFYFASVGSAGIAVGILIFSFLSGLFSLV